LARSSPDAFECVTVVVCVAPDRSELPASKLALRRVVRRRSSYRASGANARISQDEQVVSTQPPGVAAPATIDVGGPLETIAVHRSLDLVEVREPDGNLRWQTPGQVVQVEVAIDELGFIVVASNNPPMVSKYSP
jgi:hypothetical protein